MVTKVNTVRESLGIRDFGMLRPSKSVEITVTNHTEYKKQETTTGCLQISIYNNELWGEAGL